MYGLKITTMAWESPQWPRPELEGKRLTSFSLLLLLLFLFLFFHPANITGWKQTQPRGCTSRGQPLRGHDGCRVRPRRGPGCWEAGIAVRRWGDSWKLQRMVPGQGRGQRRGRGMLCGS